MEKKCIFNLEDKATIDRLVGGEMIKANDRLTRRGLKVYAFTYETFAREPKDGRPIKLVSFAKGEEPESCSIAYYGCYDNFKKRVSNFKELLPGKHLFSITATEGKSGRPKNESIVYIVAETTDSAKDLAKDLSESLFWPLEETISFKLSSIIEQM